VFSGAGSPTPNNYGVRCLEVMTNAQEKGPHRGGGGAKRGSRGLAIRSLLNAFFDPFNGEEQNVYEIEREGGE